MMDLKNVDLLSLQTSYMKKDPTTQALCAALNPQFRKLADEVKLCLIYSRIDELDHTALDELAWQMHIDWYDANADIEIKRKLIKGADEVHSYLGTPYAVEEVINTYFGDGYMLEWFEYGGNPHMFKIVTSNVSVTGELAEQFLRALNPVKRKSSHLEEIVISMSADINNYYAGAVHTGDFIEIRQVM